MCERLSDKISEMKIVSAYPDEFEKRSRSGIYDSFVCAQCEDKFGTLDDYAAIILRQSPTPIVEGNGWDFGEYDYEQLKLFFLSVLWRMHACQHEFFNHMTIGNRADSLGWCLLNNSLGSDDDFTVLLAHWDHPFAHGLMPSESVGSAWKLYLPFIMVLIGDGVQKALQGLEPFVLAPNQRLLMAKKELTSQENSTVQSIAFQNLKKKPECKKSSTRRHA